jgi:hypothetical protein
MMFRCFSKVLFFLFSLNLFFVTSLVALDDDLPRCNEKALSAKLFLALECLNDSTVLVSDPTSFNWQYSFDSNKDGVSGTFIGGQYEMHGIAIREYHNEIWIAIAGTMPLEGAQVPGAINDSVSYGDLFIDVSEGNFAAASANASLIAIRFAPQNDSSPLQLGVYKNVRAKSVSAGNYGFQHLQHYLDYLPSIGGVFGFGDLPNNQTYYANNLALNLIESGVYLGAIELVEEEILAGSGFDKSVYTSLGATNIIAFRFAKNLIMDSCGVVGGDGTSCLDCSGVACGKKVNDLCGQCGGDNTSCADCMGIPNGAAVVDACGVCGGDNSSCKDCKGVVNGTAKIDACGVCGGDNSSCTGCDGVLKSGKVKDACGVCGGDNSSCKDCLGVPNGLAKIDLCGVCNGQGNSCLDCKGIANGTAKVDACGVCDGNITDPSLCISSRLCPGGVFDQCGVCNGSNACVDCAGVPNGGSLIDCCGVCGGDGSTCLDKCKFYNVSSIKKESKNGIKKLLSSVNKYSAQQARCLSSKAGVANKRILSARKLQRSTEKSLSVFTTKNVKSCDTEFCIKQSFTTTIKSVRVNTKKLYQLSRDAQYGAGAACKTVKPKNTTNNRSSSQNLAKVQNSLNKLPNLACLN